MTVYKNSAAPLEAHLGFWLRYVSNHVSARFQALLEDQAISVTEWVALRTFFNEESATHPALIQSLGMTKGAASKVISRLEKKGLLQRQLMPNQSKQQRLILTTKGRKLVPQLAALADANEEYFFGHLDLNQRRALIETMRALVIHHQLKTIPTN